MVHRFSANVSQASAERCVMRAVGLDEHFATPEFLDGPGRSFLQRFGFLAVPDSVTKAAAVSSTGWGTMPATTPIL